MEGLFVKAWALQMLCFSDCKTSALILDVLNQEFGWIWKIEVRCYSTISPQHETVFLIFENQAR